MNNDFVFKLSSSHVKWKCDFCRKYNDDVKYVLTVKGREPGVCCHGCTIVIRRLCVYLGVPAKVKTIQDDNSVGFAVG